MLFLGWKSTDFYFSTLHPKIHQGVFSRKKALMTEQKIYNDRPLYAQLGMKFDCTDVGNMERFINHHKNNLRLLNLA